MDSQSSSRTAQSSIRSFFQPLLQQSTQQPKSQPILQPTPTKPSTYTANASHPSSPPPVRLPSSYALPPGSNPPSQQPSQPPSVPPSPHNQTKNPNIPPQAAILPITKYHITPLRRINSLLLPINYSDSFYNASLLPSQPASSNFSRIITWEGKVVGGIICRLDRSLPSVPFPSSTSPPSPPAPANVIPNPNLEQDYDIYVQSLCLLSPYRSQGLSASALQDIIVSAIEETRRGVRIKGIYAHVWTENDEALEWYKKRGFNVYPSGVVNGYYRRLKPDSAYIMRRELKTSDHLAVSSSPDVAAQEGATQLPRTPQETQVPSAPPTPTIPPPPNNTPAFPTPTPTPLPPSSIADPKPRPPIMPHARSFQDRGPDREWNDLPEDVLSGGSLTVPGSSNASSRSSSRSGLGDGTATIGRGGKKKRVYPAAAFGS